MTLAVTYSFIFGMLQNADGRLEPAPHDAVWQRRCLPAAVWQCRCLACSQAGRRAGQPPADEVPAVLGALARVWRRRLRWAVEHQRAHCQHICSEGRRAVAAARGLESPLDYPLELHRRRLPARAWHAARQGCQAALLPRTLRWKRSPQTWQLRGPVEAVLHRW